MRYLQLPFGLPEEVAKESFVIATFLFSDVSSRDVLDRAAGFAVGQSVGTWLDIPGVTKELTENHQARILQIYGPFQDADETFVARFAFPWENFGDSIAQMLTALVGNDVSTSVTCKLLDIEISCELAARFSGPKHGTEGIRSLLGVYDRPIILNMIKPCTGYGPEVGAQFFYEAARGGVDIIKDDELLGNTGFSSVVGRVKAYLAAAQRAYEETGFYTHYCVNISDRVDRISDNAKAALDAGGKMVMVNFVTLGLDALWALSETFGSQLIILGHYAGVGIVSASYPVGVSQKVYNGKLPRLAGADIVVVPYSEANRRDYLEVVQQLQLPMGTIGSSLPALGGGMTPRIATSIAADLGIDVVFAVGGAIQGHPMGTTAGALAMRKTAEAIGKGISLKDLAAESEEVRIALQIW